MATLFVACKDESYEQPNTFSDVGFYTGGARQNVLRSTVGNYMSFMDLSQGTVDHTWTIQEGNFFLEGPIERRDTVFEQFIINRGDTVSKEDVVHVLFSNGGFNEVTLHNTFHDSVAFRGNNGVEDYILPSVKVGDLWVIDTTFVVDVYEDIVPEIEIRQDGALVSHESPSDVITVEVGGTLEFTDLTSIGRPTSRVWTVAGELNSEQVFEPVFKKLGVQNAQINLTRSGEFIPGGSARYVVPATINVVPSSKPFQLTGTIAEQEDETIQIPFNGEFISFSGQEDFFKVTVNDIDFPIASVTLNSTDATVLDIKLQDAIYRPDVIKVTFLSGSTLESSDSRVPGTFTDEPVEMHNVNLLSKEIGNVDNFGSAWQGFQPAWGSNQGVLEFTDEKKTAGDYSIKLTMAPGQRISLEAVPSTPLIFEADVPYIIRYKMYVESSTVLPSEVSLWLLSEWKSFWQTPDVPKGEWVTIENELTNGAPLAKLYWRSLQAGAGNSDYVVYLDDFYIAKKEERP